MSLFGSIRMSANTLQAMQIGLNVVGNNIANADTEGYVRQDVLYEAAPTQRVGNLQLGLGVEIAGVVQKIDDFLQDRRIGSSSDRAGAEVQEQAYADLETLLNELSDTDLSTSLSNFFNSFDEVLQSPASPGVRDLVVLRGEQLTSDIQRLNARTESLRGELDDRVEDVVDEINVLTEEITTLNIRIAQTEGGDGSQSDAGSLRDLRQTAIDRLGELVDARITEQSSGGVAIYVGGDFLVSEGLRRTVSLDVQGDENGRTSTVVLGELNAPLEVTSGELGGIYAARDEVLNGFLSQLDDFSTALIQEFNRIYSQGQGVIGYQGISAERSLDDANASLDDAGLALTPVSGSFDVQVRNRNTGETKTTTIGIDLNGLDDDTTLNTLQASLDAIEGITATVDVHGTLQIASEASDIDFAFAGDDSGVLAALGINTFFTGESSSTIGVSSLLEDQRLLASSLGGVAEDTRNAERLASFLDTPLDAHGGRSIGDIFSGMMNELAKDAALARSVADGFRGYEATLEAQHQAISGVNLDEEAIRLVELQRIYQAAAKHIQTISELLELLVNL